MNKQENKIPSAEEFMNSEQFEPDTGICFEDYHGDVSLIVPTMMIEFAKLHVKAALESAAENAESITDIDKYIYGSIVDEDSILSAYPEELIK